MDPNHCFDLIIRLLVINHGNPSPSVDTRQELVEHLLALAMWIEGGGFLPTVDPMAIHR